MVAGYGGGDILKQVSLDVPEGRITCIVGPNGAGKSTLLATISGLLRLRRGEIRFGGQVISGLAPRQILARGISHVPQAHSLFPDMTVRENVEMGAFTINDRALVRAAAEDRAGALPDRQRARRREGRQPVGRPAAPGGVRALHDARPDV